MKPIKSAIAPDADKPAQMSFSLRYRSFRYAPSLTKNTRTHIFPEDRFLKAPDIADT
jgi:hypothetical protein